MYASLDELPPQVLNSFDRRDAKRWMDEYNKALGDGKSKEDVRKARKKAWEALSRAPTSLSFDIVATADIYDRVNEKVHKMEDHLDEFIDRGGNIQNWHRSYNIATVWDWYRTKAKGKDGKEVDAIGVKGNMFGGAPVYNKAREEFLNGTNSLSIGGLTRPRDVRCTDKGCFRELDLVQLMEISLCPTPMNPLATLRWHSRMEETEKAEPEGVTLGVVSMTVHKDHTMCPMQALKKEFLDEGYADVHAREYGVYLACDDGDRRAGMAADLGGKGWYVKDDGAGLYVNRPKAMVEAAFRDTVSSGKADAGGFFTAAMDEDTFKSLARLGLVRKDCGLFRLVGPDGPGVGLNSSGTVEEP